MKRRLADVPRKWFNHLMSSGATGSVLRDDDCVVQRAVELGIDLGLIDENLSLSPMERMRQHDESVRQVLAVQKRLGVAEEDEA